MGDRESYAPGTFSWADLATTDAAAARAFYARVLGWEAVDEPGPSTRFRLDGRDVAALREIDGSGMPPHWSSYVTVEDVDAAAARAGELGAELVCEPLDVQEAGRMAVVRDPTGAIAHLWQPKERAGAGRVNDPGCMVWNELATPDPARATAFYRDLLGWTAEPDGTGYATIKRGEALNGGIRPTQDGEPPNWLVYFTAAAIDEAAEAAADAGGEVVAGPLEGALGRIAVVADPQGAVFALFEGQVDP